jgi:integrase
VRLGALPANPVTDTRAPARARSERATWTETQVAAVLTAVRDDPRYHALYLVALTTGVRPGELRALMWSDLDADRGVLTVRRSMTRTDTFRHIIGDGTKTGRRRTIALPAVTVAALATCRADQRQRQIAAPAWRDLGVIFDRGDGNPIPQQTLASVHDRTAARAGVPRITVHGMRHTFATIALANGVHPKIVAEILGHSSIGTTLDIYSHVSVDMQRSVIDSLAERITDAREKRA